MAAPVSTTPAGPLDPLRPHNTDSTGTGAVLSLVAHAGLVAALTLGVQWRSSPQTAVVEAELWSSVPQMAAPPAPPPPVEPEPAEPEAMPAAHPAPPPRPTVADEATATREAQIALERDRARKAREAEEAARQKQRQREEQARKDKADKLRLEREKAEKAEKAARAERERAEKEKAEKAEKARKEREAEQRKQQDQEKAAQAKLSAAEEARLKKLREDQIRRMNAQLGAGPSGQAVGNGAPGSTGTAARSAGPGDGAYAGRIIARVKPNIVLTDPVPGNPEATVEVRVGPDGTILARRLIKPSGSTEWDEAVLRAIDRTGILPRKPDGTVEPRLEIKFKPRD